MRWLGVLFVVVLLGLGWIGYSQPERFWGIDLPGIVYAVMALLLVSGASFGFWRFRAHKRAALAGIVFWPLAIIGIIWAYETFR